MTEFAPESKPEQVNRVLVEADNPAIELENITDQVKQITDGCKDPSNNWLMTKRVNLPSGLEVTYAFTDGHEGGEFASIVESMPRIGRNISRKWDHKDASNSFKQEVTTRTRDHTGRYVPGETQFGFNRKDLNRMNKLLKDSMEHLEADG